MTIEDKIWEDQFESAREEVMAQIRKERVEPYHEMDVPDESLEIYLSEFLSDIANAMCEFEYMCKNMYWTLNRKQKRFVAAKLYRTAPALVEA